MSSEKEANNAEDAGLCGNINIVISSKWRVSEEREGQETV